MASITTEEFDAILLDLLAGEDATALLDIPGVYELVSAHYNNEVLSIWQGQRDAECEEAEQDEPQEEDITTDDHQHFYYIGKCVVEVGEDDDWMAAVGAWCKANGYFPNVWWVSDHGNAHLISVSDDGRYLGGKAD